MTIFLIIEINIWLLYSYKGRHDVYGNLWSLFTNLILRNIPIFMHFSIFFLKKSWYAFRAVLEAQPFMEITLQKILLIFTSIDNMDHRNGIH